mmetsp:Transcript_44669/g.142237  ORF Transcript_44669/g.142237 Transcript_44669/m.142237 type:complete len:120 (-) Transcript_44669:56-415(-)
MGLRVRGEEHILAALLGLLLLTCTWQPGEGARRGPDSVPGVLSKLEGLQSSDVGAFNASRYSEFWDPWTSPEISWRNSSAGPPSIPCKIALRALKALHRGDLPESLSYVRTGARAQPWP